MNGKENIVKRILDDADAKAKYIVEQAEAKVATQEKDEEAAIAAERDALDAKIASLGEERVANALASAKLEARKYKLSGKQKLIGECYDKAYKALCALDGEQTKALIATLLQTYAENGETVYFAAKDTAVVTQAFWDGFGKQLKLGGAVDIDGGILLCGEGYDKDLSLAKLVDYAREKTEAAVAETLFGGTNV